MNKDLESIYREAFNSSQIDTEDWNLPSDSVWENIEEEIKPKKKRRIEWFWLPTACLALGFYIFQTFSDTTRQISLEKQVKQNVEQSITVQSELSVAKVNNPVIIEKPPISESAENLTGNKRKQLVFTNDTKVENKTVQNNISIPIAEEKQTLATTAVNESRAEVKEKILKDSIQSCNMLPILALQELKKEGKKPNLYIPKEMIKPYKAKNLQLIADVYLLNIKNKTTSGIASTTDFSGEKLEFAYQTGLAIRKNLGKSLFLELGAQYHELRYQLKYEMGLPFNGVGEMENSKGNYDNTYSGAVSTSIGELKMQMVLERQLGHSVPQGEIIPLSAEGEARLSSLRLPIAFGFRKSLGSRLNLNSKVLVSQNINISHKAQFKQVLSHHSAVKESLTEVLEAPKPKTWVPELGLGIELEYRLTPKWGVKADAIGIQSIRSIYQNNDFTNKHLYYGFGLGLTYRM